MDTILPFITPLLAGTFLGLLTSAYLAYLQHKHDVNIKIIEQYFDAREQLCDKLSDLANLQVASGCKLESTVLAEYRRDLSKLFYKYYDFLPPEVLKEMLCLHACLSDKKNRLYKHENNSLFLMEDQDIRGFVKRIALIDNFQYYAPIPLKSKDSNMREAASVNYQARGVLVAINHYFTIQRLVSWNRYLQKPKKDKQKLYNALLRNKALLQTNFVKKDAIIYDGSPIEDQLVEIIASSLGLMKVELDDNFLNLGGDSLLALEIISRVNRKFDIQLPLVTFFENPTSRELAIKIMQNIPTQP